MDDLQAMLEKVKAAVERGDKAGAKSLLDELIFHEPDHEQAWMILAEVVTDSNEIKDCLRQVYRINPNNPSKKVAAVILDDKKKAEKEREKKEQRQNAKEARAKLRKERVAEKKERKKNG